MQKSMSKDSSTSSLLYNTDQGVAVWVVASSHATEWILRRDGRARNPKPSIEAVVKKVTISVWLMGNNRCE
jgi:hypothetical protein